MKRGTEYAKRIKQLHQQMLKKYGKPNLPEPTDPIQQLIIGILAENSSEHKAATLFKRICEQMVDLNELRVTPPLELAEIIGNTVPQARDKAERIIRVLNEIRVRQDSLDLSFLKQRGRREAREYLESIEGVSLFAAASVISHSLNGHAIPVDYLSIYVLRKEKAVDDTADLAVVQSFLERNIAAADSRSFAILLNRHVTADGARVQVNRLPELLNLAPPPPLKPWRKPGMDKPGLPLPRDGEVGLTDLDVGPLDEPSFEHEHPDLDHDNVEESAQKQPAAKASTQKKKQESVAAKASKPSGETKVKSSSKSQSHPTVKKKK